MTLEIAGKSYELDYTFNSFRYMQDFDFGEMEELNTKPFKMIGIATSLLYGALNCKPNKKFTEAQAESLLEKYCDENSITELLEQLTGLLTNSGFFKTLQAK